MNRWFLRMSNWVRNPPSEKRFWMVVAILAFCLAVFAIERTGWWPDWATTQKFRGSTR